LLLDGKANPSKMTDYGVTPLWLACQNGNASIVRALLKAGAAVPSYVPWKADGFDDGCPSGQLESVQALADHGAALNTREKVEDKPQSCGPLPKGMQMWSRG
jgi:ankyrin repeat protein